MLFSALVALIFCGALLITDTFFTTVHGYDIWYIRLVVISRPVITSTLIFGYISFIIVVSKGVEQLIRELAAHNHQGIPRLSVLRVMDIVVWMEHRGDHRKKCKGSPIFREP